MYGSKCSVHHSPLISLLSNSITIFHDFEVYHIKYVWSIISKLFLFQISSTLLSEDEILYIHMCTFSHRLIITKKRSSWGKMKTAVMYDLPHAGDSKGNIRTSQVVNRCNPALILHTSLQSPRLLPPSVPKVTPCVKLLDTRRTSYSFNLCFTSLKTETE